MRFQGEREWFQRRDMLRVARKVSENEDLRRSAKAMTSPACPKEAAVDMWFAVEALSTRLQARATEQR